MRVSRRHLIALVVLALAGCGETRSDLKLLDETLDQWASTVRWGEPAQLVGFIDPDVIERQPVRQFDLERLRQLRVAGYRTQPPVMLAPDRARQTAEVELVNVNNQTSRTTVETTEWRYDPVAKRWWLTSGLPRYDAR